MKPTYKLKLMLAAGLICWSALQTIAQGVYLKAGAGYTAGLGGDIKYNTTTTKTLQPANSSQIQSIKYERVNENYGKGILIGGAIGYMFTKQIGTEVGVNYLSGAKNQVTESFKFTNGQAANPDNLYESYSRMLFFQPALLVTLGKEKWNPYARLGLVAGKGTVYQREVRFDQRGGVIREVEFSGGIALGTQLALGLDFISLNEKLILFGEVTLINLRYSPDKGRVTRYQVNGKEELANLPVNEKEFEFADNFEVDYTAPAPEASPAKEKRFSLPFGSAGINIGVKFRL